MRSIIFTRLMRGFCRQERIWIQGRAQIKDFWKQAIVSLGVKDAKLSSVHAEAAGDTVVEVGRADLTLEGGQTLAVKYVVHWKQEDGIWKWHTDIWNLNQ